MCLFSKSNPYHSPYQCSFSSGAWVYNDLMKAAGSQERAKLEEMDRRLRPDEPVNMQFTSGTTGHPKGATLTHFGLNNNAYFAGIRLGWDREVRSGS